MSTPLDERQIANIAAHEGIDPALVRSISNAAVANDVSPTLLLAVAKRETDFGRGSGYNATTGLGDHGHGFGMFQLDNRTPAHGPLLAEVQHDPGRAAEVAASMLHESLQRGLSAIDAVHVYNSGSLHRQSTRGVFDGHSVPYETAVVGWAHEFDVAAGLAAPQRARESQPVTQADQAFVNERIHEAAEKMRGMSTHTAQTHDSRLGDGHVACAYSVNQVLDTALGRTYGANPLSVTSVMADLKRHGTEIDPHDIRPGDIAIKEAGRGEAHGHIGIVTQAGEDPRILNNSSGRGSLSNNSTPSDFAQNYEHKGVKHHVVYYRVDPASVDLAYAKAHTIPEHVLGADHAPPHVGNWVEHKPTVGQGRGAAVASPSHDISHTPPKDDRSTRGYQVIHGEIRAGHLVETPEELHLKNAIMAEAVRDARAGETLDVRFVGNGRETAREVALQNEKLQHAIEAHLPAGAMPHLVKPGEHHEATTSSSGTKSVSDTVDKVIERVESGAKQLAADVASWKPDMSFEHFEKLMTRARGGIAPETHASPELTRAQLPERAPDIGR